MNTQDQNLHEPAEPVSEDWKCTNPKFMIIGAAKSGTTSLYTYLLRHPRLFLPTLKEPEFFSRQQIFDRGFQWYEGLFEGLPAGALSGEASTTYTRWPHTLDAPHLIHQHTSASKFIYLLRNPVDRAYSHYCHHMRTGVTMTFEQALERDEIYFDCGDYMRQIERYLRFFEPSSIEIVFNEDLRAQPAVVLNRLQEFLEVDTQDLASAGPVARNRGDDDHFLRYKTTKQIRRIPGMSKLIDRIPKQLRQRTFDAVRSTGFARRIAQQHQVPKLLPETCRDLAQRYAPSVKKLEEFVGRGLLHWLEK